MVWGEFRNQRGAGAIGCLFMTVFMAAVIYAGLQFGMPRFQHSSFEERITESITAFNQQDPAETQKQIIQIASEFDIALTPAQVQVAKPNKLLQIDVTYEKVIDLKFWQTTKVFELHRKVAP